MKLVFAIAIVFASLQSSSQKPGYLDFVMNKPLTQSMQAQYTIKTDASSKNKYYIDGKVRQLTFYGLPVDTLWFETDKKNLVKTITLKTTAVKKEDYRAFNFEWQTLLDHMSYDFGSYTAGQVKYSNTLVATWLVQSEFWLYATMEKVFPWQKDQQRTVYIRWRKYRQFRDLQ